MTKQQALAFFKDSILPSIPSNDTPWKCEAWNDYVDSLQKDGSITEKQASTWVNPF